MDLRPPPQQQRLQLLQVKCFPCMASTYSFPFVLTLLIFALYHYKIFFPKLGCFNVDSDPQCNIWKDAGWCSTKKEQMKINCMKTCNLCAGKSYSIASIDLKLFLPKFT